MNRLISFTLFTLLTLIPMAGYSSPEDTLYQQIDDLDHILNSNMNTPAEGIKQAKVFLDKHLFEAIMLRTQMMSDLQKIKNTKKRARRFRKISKKFTARFHKLETTAELFFEKAQNNKEARMELDRFLVSYPILKPYLKRFLVVNAEPNNR